MKIFIVQKWYKLLISCSAGLFSLAIFIFSVRSNTVSATPPPDGQVFIVAVASVIYEVTYHESSGEYSFVKIGAK